MRERPSLKVQLGAALLLLALVFGFSYLSGTGAIMAAPAASAADGKGLTAFRSDAELSAFLRRLRKRQPEAPAAMFDVTAADSAELGAAQATAADSASNSLPGITNVQEAGVDEGGIVKVHRDNLVILRRGRLFTVSLAGGGMRPVDSIDAFPPSAQASEHGDWYDEMLVAGDRVIVVGYSYSRGGTEINRFRIDPAGRLRFEDAYHLRSNDYYSSRNYASRLIGNRLIFYTPLYLSWNQDPLEALPGLRRWRGDATEQGFRRIAEARQVYIPPILRDSPDARIDTLHSVTSCDLTAPTLDCSATAVLGPESRTFYVSGEAVYLWVSDAWSHDSRMRGAEAYIFRLPLDGSRPAAVGARGAPIDQFSFREDKADGLLNVLVRTDGGGDAMFRPEESEGEVSLLRVPFGAFGDGSRRLTDERYRRLPSPGGDSWWFHNRFVGDYVLYGGGDYYGEGRRPSRLVVAPLRSGRAVELELGHGVDRIEVLGRDAMVVGGGARGLGFTAVELGGPGPRIGDTYVHANSSEGESRSHAFFFKPDAGSDGASGVVGLPVARPAPEAYARFFGSAAAMVFLRRLDRRLSPAGELAASMEGVADDGCKASCVDWYGNARPIFLGRRTFALLGYELVEGNLAGATMRELGRVNYAPRPAVRAGR